MSKTKHVAEDAVCVAAGGIAVGVLLGSFRKWANGPRTRQVCLVEEPVSHKKAKHYSKN